MSEEKIERLFRWIDLLRWVLYGLVAGAISLAVWATKIQFSIADLRADVDKLAAKEVPEEHRFTALEQWIRDHDVSKVQR